MIAHSARGAPSPAHSHSPINGDAAKRGNVTFFSPVANCVGGGEGAGGVFDEVVNMLSVMKEQV